MSKKSSEIIKRKKLPERKAKTAAKDQIVSVSSILRRRILHRFVCLPFQMKLFKGNRRFPSRREFSSSSLNTVASTDSDPDPRENRVALQLIIKQLKIMNHIVDEFFMEELKSEEIYRLYGNKSFWMSLLTLTIEISKSK